MSRDWSAVMIGSDEDFAGAPLLRKEFVLDDGDVRQATLYATARGVFTASINGVNVSDDVLSPGWTSYEWRMRYREYDVTNLLTPNLLTTSAAVVLGLELGNGWFRGRLGWNEGRAFYGSELGALAELEIRFADGHVQTVGTDGTWRAGPSAVLANDLYDGETIDARLLDDAWKHPGFTHDGWVGVHEQDFALATLTPYVGPAVRRQQEIRPVAVWTSPTGRTLVDFGQNLVGWVRFSVRGEAGAVITIRHAEVLEHGELATRPLRSAQACDRFILSGAHDRFEPGLTFHGFRYAEISGWPGELGADDVVAVVVHSTVERTGYFECSDELLNQLHSNVVWGTRGNILDVPTDCPQRDERLGWTGDLAVFAPTAAFLFDVDGLLRDWLADLAAEQRAAGGRVPFVVPDILKYEKRRAFSATASTAIWGDAAVWVPWALWQAYGDARVLGEAFESMAAHVRRARSATSETGLWDQGFQFGDWLDPTAPPDQPFLAKADPGVVATACLYRSARTVADAATILHRAADAEEFAALAQRTKAAFNTHYVTAEGTVHSDCPTAYALAIAFGLLDTPVRALAGDRLAALVAANGYRIATGFAGTPYVTDALSATGHLGAAYRLLSQRECPSWLYPVTMGATTIWERWDAILPDGTVNPGEMTSFNHYALGAVADWMHRVILGINAGEPGYRTIRIAPRPGGGLTWARGSLKTPHGPVGVSWQHNEGGSTVTVTVPDGAKAEIDLPGKAPATVGAGEHTVRW